MTFQWPADVEGYLFEVEGRALYDLARECSGTVVELGSYKGLSTVCLAQGVRDSGRDGMVIAVDHFQGERDPGGVAVFRDYRRGAYRGAFGRNVLAHQVRPWVRVISAVTWEAAQYMFEPVSLLFIDAAHDVVSVSLDWQAWQPYLAREGVVVFHDRGAVGPAAVTEGMESGGDWIGEDGPGSLRIMRRVGADTHVRLRG